jgi:hypothetical protein
MPERGFEGRETMALDVSELNRRPRLPEGALAQASWGWISADCRVGVGGR